MQHSAIGPTEHAVRFQQYMPFCARGEDRFGPVSIQDLRCPVVEINYSRLMRLWRRFDHAVRHGHHAAANREPLVSEVDIAPSQSTQLATTHAREGRQMPERLELCSTHMP